MSVDAPFTPPKKKPNVMWWLLGGFMLLLFIFFFQLLGPNPKIIVSPQTTHITAPLGPDGLPDYERYLLEKSRSGVTPENNAAVLLVKAIWPGELDPKDYAAVVKELGLPNIPSKAEALTDVYDRSTRAAILNWLTVAKMLPAAPATDDDQAVARADIFRDEFVDSFIDRAMSRPWKSEQLPPLSTWAEANRRPLDMIVEASRRPRFYSPSPSLVNRERELLVAMLLPTIQASRSAARSLSARAMWHVGEGRPEEAWQDLLAIHRLGRLLTQGETLVEQLVGIAVDGIATRGTYVLLDQGDLTAQQARRVQQDLAVLPSFNRMSNALDGSERLMFVDTVVGLGQERGSQSLPDMGLDIDSPVLDYVSVDWNVVLRIGNEFYDRLVAAARIADPNARRQAFTQLDNDVLQLSRDMRQPTSIVAGVISPRRRSEIVAAYILGQFLPAVEAAGAA